MASLSTHVLDTAGGRPAVGVHIVLESESGGVVGEAATDADGRVSGIGPEPLPHGDYRLRFHTGAWYAAPGRDHLLPRGGRHLHGRGRRAPSRPVAAEPVRLLHLPWQLTSSSARAARSSTAPSARSPSSCATGWSPSWRRTTRTCAATAVVVLADDEVLLPGLVDTHVHVNEPGRTAWEGFASATAAAAAGGVTTIVDMPLNSIPPTTTVAALEVKRAVAWSQAFVDVGFWGGAVPGNLDDLAPLHREGVFGFKCFTLDSGVEEFAPLDSDGLDLAMHELAGLDALLLVHAEDGAEIAAAPPCDGSVVRRLPRLAPASRRGGRHRPRGRGRPADRRAGARRPSLRRRRAPDAAAGARGGRAGERGDLSALPDVRRRGDARRRHRAASAARRSARPTTARPSGPALADGTIDLVVTDHSPCTADLKRADTGDFGTAWGGIASLELGLPRGLDARPGSAGTRWSTSCAGWPRHPPTWSASPARAGSPSAPPPTCAPSRPTTRRWSTPRGCTTRTP